MNVKADGISAKDRRRHHRVRGPFEGRRIGLLCAPIRLYDLSEGGCFIHSFLEQRVGLPLVLEIDLPGEGPIQVNCEALYTMFGFGFAVRFVEVPDETAMRLGRGLRKIREAIG